MSDVVTSPVATIQSHAQVQVDPLRVGNKIARLSAARKDAEARAVKAEADLATRPTSADFAKLKGEVQAAKHRKAFDAAAGTAKIKPDLVGDLLALSGYQATDGDPDPKAIAALIGETVATRAYLVESGEPVVDPAAKLTPGEGSGRGPIDRLVGGFKVTTDQLRNPEWMRLNQAAIAKATKDGTFSVV